MKKTIMLIFIISISFSLFAQSAGLITIEEISGKVQVKQNSSAWQDASPGLQVPAGTMISTGFKSTASLNTGNAVIEVAQLTRLTIEELLTQDNTQTTSLFLNGGKINAEVSRENLRQDFTVRSSVATASVRGTGFSFDGRHLRVRHGAVMIQSGGRSVLAIQGDRIQTSATSKPGSRVNSLKEENEVVATLTLEEEDEEETTPTIVEEPPTDTEEYIPDPEELQADLTISIR